MLDVGSGRTPTIPIGARPDGARYVGLDVSSEELAKAPPGSYDDVVVADVTDLRPELSDRFDLVISFQVFEHVRSMRQALQNIHAYLGRGGDVVVYTSATFAWFGLANRLVPISVTRALQERLMAVDPGKVFPAYYDHCWYAALHHELRGWTNVEVVPLYLGAQYFNFAPPLRRAYLLYEDWARRSRHRNLATHYVFRARKP